MDICCRFYSRICCKASALSSAPDGRPMARLCALTTAPLKVRSVPSATGDRWTSQNAMLRLGIVQQLGETGVALNTLVITLHTFATVFFRWQPSRRPHFWIFVVAAIWLYLGLFVGIGYALHTGSRMQNGAPYYGPTP